MSLRVADADIRAAADFVPARAALSIDWALVMSTAGTAKVLTHHPIIAKDGKAAILPGQPVERELAEQLLEALREQPTAGEGWITPELLYRSDRVIAWFSPAKVRPMHCKPDAGKGLTLQVPWPALVFIARRDRSLSVYAVCGSERPGPKTPLHHAPLANVYDDGSLCWGDITPPPFGMQSIAAWESAIYRTWFTSPNHDAVLRWPKTRRARGADRSKLGAAWLAYWRGLHSAKAKAFPERDLIPAKLTLEKALGA